jgi:hypothetical protein
MDQIGEKNRADSGPPVVRGGDLVTTQPNDQKPGEHDQDDDHDEGLPEEARNER